MTGPSSVMATVCSTWAARLPSVLRTVQPLGSTLHLSMPPARNQGSMAMTRPGASRRPRPGRPALGMCGSSCLAASVGLSLEDVVAYCTDAETGESLSA